MNEMDVPDTIADEMFNTQSTALGSWTDYELTNAIPVSPAATCGTTKQKMSSLEGLVVAVQSLSILCWERVLYKI